MVLAALDEDASESVSGDAYSEDYENPVIPLQNQMRPQHDVHPVNKKRRVTVVERLRLMER